MQVVASKLDLALAQYVHHGQTRTTPVRIDLQYCNADTHEYINEYKNRNRSPCVAERT